ncbi:MAG: AAA family ATPase [Cyanobacteria bacterium SBLK]|nr:AAA family ATPase [Cyanobacteria bacterium SBLK]
MTLTLNFPGYTIEQNLYEGVKTLIYKGYRQADSTPITIKTLRAEYPTLEEITRLRHEYQILHDLDIDGVIKPHKLLNVQNRLALILEGFESVSLKQFIVSHRVSIAEFLEIAIALTQTLGKLQESRVIHKDIKPHNILINPETRETKLIDFSISTRLEQENQTWNTPNQLEGTLAYMSPEQTGRMNRSLDYRTDFYSLGVTFYEMLTGQLPFFSNDPMEIIHSHIAKTPTILHKLNTEIPEVLSTLVAKLMAKTAEKRYQSARGIQADLEECHQQWQNTGKIANFIPGKLDELGQFLIPQKLYGRNREVLTLLESFERISEGATEMMLVSGYSGVGKTRVVQEVHKPIVRQRGYFIAGKFDQFQRNIPYAALIQAFQDLIRQILTENAEKIKMWKEQILAAVGQSGQVVIEVIPEVELIIGSQPEVPQLGASESQNRFNQVFKQFINVFAQKEHPLVVFLDDLQWADISSLKLIQLLITDPDNQYFLFIGAYRDNEVSPTHPTILTIEEIEKAGASIQNIVLAPLQLDNVTELVADTVQEREKSPILAELLFNKTQGNPFFLTQLLKTLYEDNLISFDFEQGTWSWEIERIQAFGIADLGVVELVARNIQKLPEQTQKVLKLAACIGNRFYLDILGIVHEKSSLETARDFWPALQAGLILPLSKDYKIPLAFDEHQSQSLSWDERRISYKFLHDRVQQAAYSLILESDKKVTHLNIGKLLLQKTKEEELEENIFDIVNQLNIGLDLISESNKKEELGNLNVLAGKKAKLSNAYEVAMKYFDIGVDLLPENDWKNRYDFNIEFYNNAIEVSYLINDIEKAEALSNIVFSHASSLLDKIKIYELKLEFYFSQIQLEKGLNLGLETLELLNIKLPKKPNKLNILIGLMKLKWQLRLVKKDDDIMNLAVMTDPYKLAALKIMITLIPITFTLNPSLFPIIVLKMIEICLTYGLSELSAFAFGSYAIILNAALGDFESSYQFGCLSLKVLEKFESEKLKAKVYMMFNSFVVFLKEKARNAQSSFLEAIQSGLVTGDIAYVNQCAINASIQLFLIGEHLDSVGNFQTKYIKMMEVSKEEFLQTLLRTWNQLCINLSSESIEQPCQLTGEVFDEEKMMSIYAETDNLPGIIHLKIVQLIANYTFRNATQSLVIARFAEQYQQGVQGTLYAVHYNFYFSLALLANYLGADRKEQKQYLKKVKSNQKQMKKWAHHAPMNFQHKYDLVEAEIARVIGDINKAALLYDLAISGAKTHQYIHEEALANELAAEHYQALGRINIAKIYMTEAYYGYIRWGAKAKVKDLDRRHPDLIIRTIRTVMGSESPLTSTTTSLTTHSSTNTHTTTGLASQVLDLNTVFKASLALSGELVVENLLEKLLKISIENAGATMGLFLTKLKKEWTIEAKGQIDQTPKDPQQTSAATEETRVNVEIVSTTRHAFPRAVLNYVEQTKQNLVLDNAVTDDTFGSDLYIQEQQTKSILCLPLIHQNKLTGILYLENNEISGAFTQERLKVINLLASQISISVDNARLYTQLEEYSRTLETKVAQRTQQLSEKNTQLEDTLKELQTAQKQIVAQEKLASLGALTAGIAHEIRNPLNFVNSLANLSEDLTQDLVEEINRQSDKLDAESIEFLNESLEYLKRNVSEIHQQGKRADSIITSMLMHARTGNSKPQPGDLNFVVAEAVQLAHHSLIAKDASFNVELNAEYDESIGEIVMAAADLGRAIINIVDNACYAARKKAMALTEEEFMPEVSIMTCNRDSEVEIVVRDNGNGIPTEIQDKIFNPFFTTKPTGEGTGLGLSICNDIISGQHRGKIEIVSREGGGTEVTIAVPRQLPEIESSETQSPTEETSPIPHFQSENRTPYFKD